MFQHFDCLYSDMAAWRGWNWHVEVAIKSHKSITWTLWHCMCQCVSTFDLAANYVIYDNNPGTLTADRFGPVKQIGGDTVNKWTENQGYKLYFLSTAWFYLIITGPQFISLLRLHWCILCIVTLVYYTEDRSSAARQIGWGTVINKWKSRI